MGPAHRLTGASGAPFIQAPHKGLGAIDRQADFRIRLSMRRAIIAVLLSALVFPGLGQLYNQDRRKGIFLVLGANALLAVLLVATLMLLSREYAAVYYPRPLTLEIFKSLLLDTAASPLFWLPFGLLLALWGYAAVDAGRRANPVRKEES
jgi:hypothetical protein